MVEANRIHPATGGVDVLRAEPPPITLGKSRQGTALALKSLSYQKRQTFTNVCCISLCPLIMVGISAILGNLITRLINSSQSPNEYVYCSNVNSMNALNLPRWNDTVIPFPSTEITDANRAEYPESTLGKVLHANWARVVFSNNRGPPGAASTTFQRPCVFWHEQDYPLSALYEQGPGPNATGKFVRDATRLAQPLNGWGQVLVLNSPLVEPQTINIFSQYQERTSIIVDYADGVDPALLGSKPFQAALSAAQFAALPTDSPNFESPQSSSTGILGTIPTRFFIQLTSISDSSASGSGFLPVPWYNLSRVGPKGLDDLISAELNQVIQKIAALPKEDLIGGTLTEKNAVFLRAGAVLQNLPHGAIYFKKIDHTAKQYSYDFHIGTDLRVDSSSNFPTKGRRMLLQQTQLGNAILRNGNVGGLGAAQITHGFRILPQVRTTLVALPFGGIIGVILYPFGISFLLPIFAIILIQEKEQRILVMMKMNGMNSWPYYISHYVTFFVLYAISALIFVLAGAVGQLTLFTLTSPGILFVMFLLWGNCMIALSFFFSSLFNRSRFALVSIFLIVLCSVIVALVVDELFIDSQAPILYFVWPPFAFYRCLSLVNRASYTNTLIPYKSFDQLVPGDEVFNTLISLAVEIPIYLALAYYFQAILPTEFGVRKPWHFPITDLLKKKKRESSEEEEKMAVAIQIDEKEVQFEDQDVKDERARVLSTNFSSDEYPLIMKNMRKVYAGRGGQGPKLAVKDVTFAVEKGITFGLLGPNGKSILIKGAGKTTLISILTGLYEISSGNATIAGFDIKTSSEEVYKCIGICPQFDIQWDELTVGEHLYFYARLKGVQRNDEVVAVQRALKEVSLTAFENRLTKGLSGGERRRLSIAIALLGNPNVVFLDEPTTGLDPEVRRLIWDIINNARAGRTIVLTTHSMEEAEALCQRIGIMAKGTLRCHANPTRLKQLYGSGFKIFVTSLPEDKERACKFIESLLPAGFKSIDSFAATTSYEFPAAKGILSSLFLSVEKGKAENGILDWGIGETSLEEVFIRLISEADASAEY